MSSDDERKRPRGRRALSGDERELWHIVTRSIAPLRGRTRKEATAIPAEDPVPVAPPTAKVKAKTVGAPPAPCVAVAKPSPPLAPLDRRLTRRVARGNAALDARLDLHGMTQEQAHYALLRFIRSAQADGAKVVLVITGKGLRGRSDGGGERGVLRRLVPHWLGLAEFRTYIVGFEAAHVTHGGEGALYVRLRRGR
jgi:DNA-nicking Smr family endonuclease